MEKALAGVRKHGSADSLWPCTNLTSVLGLSFSVNGGNQGRDDKSVRATHKQMTAGQM